MQAGEFAQPLQHPAEAQICQRVVVVIAAADIGMHAGKPALLDDLAGCLVLGGKVVPKHRREFPAVLVDRQGMQPDRHADRQFRAVKLMPVRVDHVGDPRQSERLDSIEYPDDVRHDGRGAIFRGKGGTGFLPLGLFLDLVGGDRLVSDGAASRGGRPFLFPGDRRPIVGRCDAAGSPARRRDSGRCRRRG